MPPSTFASAAAASTSSNNQNNTGARDSSEWSRRPNGATQTFRRSSNAASSMSSSTAPGEQTAVPSQPPRYVPPHRNGTVPETRYSKDQLLGLFRTQQNLDGSLKDGMNSLYVGGWHPDLANGAPPSAGWGRNDHSRDPPAGPDVCWDKNGVVEPLGLTEMDDEEKELFTTSVNTPLKPPTTQTKDNQQSNGVSNRKISISQNLNSPGFALPSPSGTRGARRRELSESYPFPDALASPTGGFNRSEQRPASPPPSLLRRRTDLKDLTRLEERDKEGEEKSSASPFGTLKRQTTGPLSAGFGAPASPWSTTAPQTGGGFSPMGSFGNFGLGSPAPGTPGEKRPAGMGSGRAESRFKNLLQKDSSEDIGGKGLERKPSLASLARVNEHESWRPQDRPVASDAPLEEAEEDSPVPSGSAALAAESDLSPPQNRQGLRGFDTPSRSGTRDEFGFGAFGMTADPSLGFGHGFLGRDGAQQQTPAQQRTGLQPGGQEPMSPTDTNPYQSPEHHGVDHHNDDPDTDGSDIHNAHLPGLGGFGGEQTQQHGGLAGLGSLSSLGRGPQGPASDRSQTSSVGPNRAFPGLGGLGQLGSMNPSSPWAVGQGGLGTPGRQPAGLSSAFGGGPFGNSLADMQPPSLAGLGGPQAGTPYGGSRMSSMFPQGMQDHMRLGEHKDEGRDTGSDRFGLGGLGETGFPGQGFNDSQFEQKSSEQHLPGFGPPGQHHNQAQQDLLNAQQLPSSVASNQPPAPQQRTMVMPDRMRWIYRDPQGKTQGPWSGLEMHDWYKAGFFSPELLVKKAEDAEYEPLAQLIRRIGNSREPFLVPQIGIPHGSASAQGQGPWASAVSPGVVSSGGAQPPFASSFPSFGTTLTAEQQNALERRKQEEQYLMARQKEHLAQAQMAQRVQSIHPPYPHAPGHSGQLHHHSSAQSLHSQPSFGSIASPNTYQPSPTQGPSAGGQGPAGFFDNSFRSTQLGGLGAVGAGVDSLGHIREEEIPGIMDRLSIGNRAPPTNNFGAPGQPFAQSQNQPQAQNMQSQQVQQMLQDRTRLQQEQAEYDAAQQDESNQQVLNERLQQFQQLQEQPLSGLDARFKAAAGKAAKAESTTTESSIGSPIAAHQEQPMPQEPLSLTEQVQKAASAKHSPAPAQSVWAKVESSLPQPFPPAPSQSPLPAPAAQRTGRQSVADQLHAESRSRSQTPSVETPSATIAPWAKEPAEAPRGPSLKEIQEMEAKKAAEADKLATALRRAALQREMEAQAALASAVVQPGLPSGANWATSTTASPATPTGAGPSPWAKAAQPKPTSTAAKSMAQIQKEEEARKRRVVAQTAQAQASVVAAAVSAAGGKSYANLASKVSIPQPTAGGAWTTVGSSGKTKTPAPATPMPSAAARAPSVSVVPTAQSPVVRKAITRTTTMNTSGAVNAQEEFRKWAIAELRPDLRKGIAAEEFVSVLASLPAEQDIITEAVHGSSNTIDSRHFAEEFIRRKKLADKGLVDSSAPAKSTASPANGASGNGGGWSEVAKKGPAKEVVKEDPAAAAGFRVVPAKKKGKR